ALEICFIKKTLSDLENQIKVNQDFFPYEGENIYIIKNIGVISINNEKMFSTPKKFNKSVVALDVFTHFYQEINLLYIIQVLFGTLSLQNLIKNWSSIDAA